MDSSRDAVANRTVTWLKGYDEVRAAFKCADLLQASYDGAKDTVFADVLVTLDDDPHAVRRRAEAVLFRAGVVQRLENELIPSLAARLVDRAAQAGQGDLVELTRRISTALAARIVGLDDCEDERSLDELAGLMAALHAGATVEWSTQPREEVAARALACRLDYSERFLAPALARRRAPGATGPDDGQDLLQLLLARQVDLGLDDAQVLRESVHYLVATGHTASTVLVHVMHEIWTWIADPPARRARLQEPGFIQACVSEATRLWPPSGWQFRVAARDGVLETGRAFRRGDRIGLHLIAANRDPGIYGSTAEDFDPERRPLRQVPPYGLAYGDGPHVCIGRRLAAGQPGDLASPGVLTRIAAALLAAGCRPDAERPAEIQAGTDRHQFGRYPVIFDPSLAAVPALCTAPGPGRA